MHYLRTSDLARAVGVHANTVRRYADRGILPSVARSPSGYRRFTERHLDYLRLAHQVYGSRFPGAAIRQLGVRIVQAAVSDDLGTALELAHRHLAVVRSERAQADLAAALLERWVAGTDNEDNEDNEDGEVGAIAGAQALRIGQAARELGVTIDVLRNWDRNGLITLPRDPANGYRRYRSHDVRRLRVIRMLSRSGYSLSAILRMLIQLDRGEATDLLRALDTPRPDEDVYTASDRWISALTEQEQRAQTILILVDELVQKYMAEKRCPAPTR